MPWFTTRLSTPIAAASTGSCRRRRTLVVARATLTRCQIDAEVAERAGRREHPVGDRVAAEPFELGVGPRVEPLDGGPERAQAGNRAGVRLGVAIGDAGVVGAITPASDRRRPAPRCAASSGSPPKLGHHGRKRHELHSADWCGLKSPVTHARSTALHTAARARRDEPCRTLVGLGLDGLAAAQVHQPDRRRAAGRTPPGRGTSRSARRRGCAAPSSPTGRARSCSR